MTHQIPDPLILHHDQAILVVDKPTGLLAVPGRGSDKADCLTTRLAQSFPNVSAVHRLDRDTSGLMVLALSPTAHRHLSIQFQARSIHKLYHAIVASPMPQHSGSIDLPMRKDLTRKFHHIIDPLLGKPALTHYRLLSQTHAHALLQLHPITGRSHQLRVHLAHLGHPVLGDRLYAGPDAPRLMLHATHLAFTHPTTNMPMTFDSPTPFALE